MLSGDGRRCRASEPHILSAPSGLLSSVLTEETGLGSADCPWMIKAQPGQRINITLFDFATTQLNGEVCHAYAILRETDPTRSITVCGSTMRERNVYTSVSDTVDVRVLRSPTNSKMSKGKYFLLKYDCEYLLLFLKKKKKEKKRRKKQKHYCSSPLKRYADFTAPFEALWVGLGA